MKKKAYNGARKLLLAVFPLLQWIYARFGISLATDEMSRKEKIELLTTQIRAQREKPRVGGAHIVIFALLLCATSVAAAPSPESLRVMLHAASGMSLLPQGGGGGTNSNLPFSGIAAPTGGCGAQQLFINYTTGDLYDCKATATWFKVNGGGGAGCSTSGLNKQVLYDDGAGGCLSSSILYNAGVSLDATGLRVIAAEYDSDVANGATNGTVRIAKTDFIAWRNNANSANLSLGINASDQLVYNTTAQLVTQTLANVAHKWASSYDQTTGVLTATQPDYSDLSGVPATFTPTAHNLLSTSHGDTTPAAAVRGDGFFAIGATPTWQRLAHSAASGGYFKWNGTDIVASTGAASGTGTPTACTNQFVTAFTLNADAAPTSTCTTVALGSAVSGQLPIGNVGSAGLSGTSPVTIATTGVIACATCTVTVANGTSALGTGAISSATCATVVTTSATGTATTDNIMADFNADPHAVTGYVPSASGMLTIIKYPTANNVNFLVCNNTSGSITPGAITLNWRVVR